MQMKDEKETRKKLLICARAEFIQKGYMQASLRSICKNAGVTTGALYFFYKDKEDLFASVVEAPLQKIYAEMAEHYAEEKQQIASEDPMHMDFSDDMKRAIAIVHMMYQYRDDLQLVLTKAQGSKYEHITDTFIAATQKHYRLIADMMCETAGIKPFDDYFIHWTAHMQIDIFIHMITHEPEEDKAVEHMKDIVSYLVAGWIGMLQKK